MEQERPSLNVIYIFFFYLRGGRGVTADVGLPWHILRAGSIVGRLHQHSRMIEQLHGVASSTQGAMVGGGDTGEILLAGIPSF